MSRAIQIDASRWKSQKDALRAQLDQKVAEARKSTAADLRETAAFVAEELGEHCFPSAAAIGIATAAMRFDVSRVYATASKVCEILKASSGEKTAAAFYGHWKQGNLSAAKNVVRKSGSPISGIIMGERLQPQLRESVRDKNGRVKAAHPLQLVTKEELAAHMREAIAEIGKTGAGWFACAERLGGDGNKVPWKGTARHGSDAGQVSIQETAIEITNTSPLAKKQISPGQVAAILARGQQFLLKLLQPNS